MKKSVIIGICIAAGVLVTGAVVTGVVLANTPGALLARAITNDINDFRNSEDYKFYDDVANGGSISASANFEKYADEDICASFTTYPNVSGARGAMEVRAYESDGEDLATCILAYNSDRLTISSPELVGEDVYGVDLKNIEENIDGSFLDPEEEGEYAIIGQYLVNLSSSLNGNKDIENDSYSIAEDYRKMLIDAVIENSEVAKSSDKITIAGDNISCTVVTITTDIEGFADALKAIVEYAEDDEELEAYLTEALTESPEDPEIILDEFYDELDYFKDELDDLAEEDGEIVFDFYITKSGTRLAQVDFEVNAENDERGAEEDDRTLKASLVLGKRLNDIKEISFSFDFDGEDAFEIIYKVNEDSSNLYDAEITIEAESYDLAINLEWDKKSGEYTIDYSYSSDYDDKEATLEFTYLETRNSRTFDFSDIKIKMDYEYYYDVEEEVSSLEPVIVFERNAKAPKAPKSFIEITELDEDDVEDILDDATDELEDIF